MFGRKRCKVKHEVLQIKKVQAIHTVYDLSGLAEKHEVEIRLRTDEGELLELRLESRYVPKLIQELRIAYDAIVPPMYTGNWNAGREGMEI